MEARAVSDADRFACSVAIRLVCMGSAVNARTTVLRNGCSICRRTKGMIKSKGMRNDTQSRNLDVSQDLSHAHLSSDSVSARSEHWGATEVDRYGTLNA
jgi:hypothetical protein